MSVDPYSFADGIEAEVVYQLATNPRVYTSFKEVIEIEAFPTPAAQTIMKAVTALVHRDGGSPSNPKSVVQQIHHMTHEDGTFTIDSAHEAVEFFDDGADGDMTAEDVAALFRPMVRDRGMWKSIQGYHTHNNAEETMEDFRRSMTAGVLNKQARSKLSLSWYEDIARLRMMEFLPTGILEFDKLTRGMRRGHLTTVGAPTNAGKSSFIRQCSTMTAREGGVALVITNETSEEELKLMILADLTNIPFSVLISTDTDDPIHRASMDRYRENSGEWGPIHVVSVNSGELTPAEVKRLIKEVEVEEGREVDFTGVDYGDRMTPDEGPEFPTHIFYKLIWDGLESTAQEGTGVLMTASQLKGTHKTRFAMPDDLADSRHKGRISPTVWTLNPEEAEGGAENFICVAKTKTGPSGQHIFTGPIETAFDFGRYSKLPKAILQGVRPSVALHGNQVKSALEKSGFAVSSG